MCRYTRDTEAEVSARMSSRIHGKLRRCLSDELNFEFIISQRLRFQKLPFQLDSPHSFVSEAVQSQDICRYHSLLLIDLFGKLDNSHHNLLKLVASYHQPLILFGSASISLSCPKYIVNGIYPYIRLTFISRYPEPCRASYHSRIAMLHQTKTAGGAGRWHALHNFYLHTDLPSAPFSTFRREFVYAESWWWPVRVSWDLGVSNAELGSKRMNLEAPRLKIWLQLSAFGPGYGTKWSEFHHHQKVEVHTIHADTIPFLRDEKMRECMK